MSRRTALLAASLAVAIIAAAGAALLLLPDGEAPGGTVEIVVPRGTQAKIDAGEDPRIVGDTVNAAVGDTLRIVNRDTATHVVVGYPVSPGQTISAALRRAGSFKTDCSIHEDQSVVLKVRER